MQKMFAVLTLVAVTVSPLFGAGKDTIVLVKRTDRRKNLSYEVMSGSEFKALQDLLKAESRYASKALRAAQKEWKEAEETAKKTFPRSVTRRRTARSLATYTDREAAEKKLEFYENKLFEKKEKEKKQKKKSKSKKDNKRAQRKRERELERKALEDEARELFEAKLAELLKAAGITKDKGDKEPLLDAPKKKEGDKQAGGDAAEKKGGLLE